MLIKTLLPNPIFPLFICTPIPFLAPKLIQFHRVDLEQEYIYTIHTRKEKGSKWIDGMERGHFLRKHHRWREAAEHTAFPAEKSTLPPPMKKTAAQLPPPWRVVTKIKVCVFRRIL